MVRWQLGFGHLYLPVANNQDGTGSPISPGAQQMSHVVDFKAAINGCDAGFSVLSCVPALHPRVSSTLQHSREQAGRQAAVHSPHDRPPTTGRGENMQDWCPFILQRILSAPSALFWNNCSIVIDSADGVQEVPLLCQINLV